MPSDNENERPITLGDLLTAFSVFEAKVNAQFEQTETKLLTEMHATEARMKEAFADYSHVRDVMFKKLKADVDNSSDALGMRLDIVERRVFNPPKDAA